MIGLDVAFGTFNHQYIVQRFITYKTRYLAVLLPLLVKSVLEEDTAVLEVQVLVRKYSNDESVMLNLGVWIYSLMERM